MAKFKPGDRARILHTHEDWKELIGKECTIISEVPTPSQPLMFANETWYAFHVQGHPAPSRTGDWETAESTLEPLLDARQWFEKNITVPKTDLQKAVLHLASLEKK